MEYRETQTKKKRKIKRKIVGEYISSFEEGGSKHVCVFTSLRENPMRKSTIHKLKMQSQTHKPSKRQRERERERERSLYRMD